MRSQTQSADAYLADLPLDRQIVVTKLRDVLRSALPAELEETMAYGMVTFVVPKSIFAPGYHVPPHDPLPFVSFAAQKNHLALYHLGLYMDPDLLAWQTEAYAKSGSGKLDMGKSCIRFRYTQAIPYDLIAELCRKMTVADFVSRYEAGRPKSRL